MLRLKTSTCFYLNFENHINMSALGNTVPKYGLSILLKDCIRDNKVHGSGVVVQQTPGIGQRGTEIENIENQKRSQ